ncbi:MAG TPA: EamA family transporter [Candidatus Limnocylindria bacterium]|nr:EamA family transporter [Candidatus Limnocylindria bacterium]
MSSPGRRQPSTAAVVVALLTVYVLWGSTYLGIAVMIETMPPLLAAGARYGSAGVIILGVLVAHARMRRGAILERPTAAQWRTAAIVGTLLLLGGNGGVVLGELFIPTGVAAVLVATVPIWLAVFDAAVTRRRPSGLVIGGLVAGIAGVAVLLIPVEGFGDLNPLGVVLVLGGAMAWAIGSLYSRHAPMPRSALLGTGIQMFVGGLALTLGGILLGEVGRTDVTEFSTRSVVAFVYLIVFGSILAFTAYTWLLANVPVSTVGTYAYVNPVVAVALGAIFYAEEITPRTIVAAALILGAVVAMISGRPRAAEEPGPGSEGEVAPNPPRSVAPIVRPDPEP